MKLSQRLAASLVLLMPADMAGAFSVPAQMVKGQKNVLTQAKSTVVDDSDALMDPMFIEPITAAPSSIPNGKSPDELIAIAKRFLCTSKGLGGDPDMMAETFQFEGPVVGPLSKEAFAKAIGSVDFATALPNWTPQFHGFFVDPVEEGGNRVWHAARGHGINEGPLLPFAPEATGLNAENPPQVCSLTIDHKTCQTTCCNGKKGVF